MSLRLRNLNPYELHKTLVNEYYLKKPGDTKLLCRKTTKDRTDYDVLQENHKFLWEGEAKTWEEKLAKKYFDKLFKEYTISDLSRFKENKIALRWRIEKEVVSGKGQFICGNKICTHNEGLRTWEVNFSYVEQNEKKNSLVKLRLCPECSEKLNYHTKKREVKRLKRKNRSKSRTHVSEASYSGSSETAKKKEESTSPAKEDIKTHEDHTMKSTKVEEDLEKNVWANKVDEVEDKSREDEFDEFLEDLLC